jgi:serine phosphatase RsbU (regulator of sigma subunit)
LILYTDGVVEAESNQGEQLGVGGLVSFLKPVVTCPAAEVGVSLIENIKKWARKPLRDDIYLLVAGMK